MSTSEPLVPPGRPTSDETVQLREEIERLRAALAASDAPPPRRGWWRPLVCGVMIALVALLAPLSVLATWASGQIQDTDRYIATVAPLADDPDVQQAAAARMEEVLFTYLDLDTATDELVTALEGRDLPPAAAETLRALSGPLASGVQSFVRGRIDALVASDAFRTAWIEANRTAHEELVAALTGETGGSVEVDRGAVSVNLAALVNTVKGQLVDAGFALAARIPEVEASFVILQSDDLANVQRVMGVLDDLSLWLPVLAIALVLGAMALARDRARTLLVAGLAVAGSMLLLGATLNGLRPFYLEALPESSSVPAAAAIYDQLVSFIRTALRGVLVVALAVAVVAWMSSRDGSGASAREALVVGLARARRARSEAGWSTGRVGLALGQYRAVLRAAIVGAAAVAYLAQDHPTGRTALTFIVVTALLALVIELVATDPPTSVVPDTPSS